MSNLKEMLVKETKAAVLRIAKHENRAYKDYLKTDEFKAKKEAIEEILLANARAGLCEFRMSMYEPNDNFVRYLQEQGLKVEIDYTTSEVVIKWDQWS